MNCTLLRFFLNSKRTNLVFKVTTEAKLYARKNETLYFHTHEHLRLLTNTSLQASYKKVNVMEMICFNQFVLLYEKLIRREDGCLCIWIFCISVVWHKKFSAKAQNHSCEGNNIFKVFKTNECEKHFKETCTSDSFHK